MVTIKVTREKLINIRSHPGREWTWSYRYSVDGGPVQQYGPGLASLRSRLKEKHPGADVVTAWDNR